MEQLIDDDKSVEAETVDRDKSIEEEIDEDEDMPNEIEVREPSNIVVDQFGEES